MITESNPDGGTHGDLDPAEIETQQIAFPGGVLRPKATYRCVRDIILLDWEPPTKAGEIILPQKSQQAMKLSFYSIPVIAAGPKCEVVKAGDMVLLPAEAILKVTYDGRTVFFCNEQKVLAVVEEPVKTAE